MVSLRVKGLLLLSAALAAAQQPARRILTLNEAVSLAELYSPQIQVASAQAEAGHARVETARAYPNPDFTTIAGHQHSRPIATPAVPGLLQHYSVSQPIELPVVRRTRIEAARRSQESSQTAITSAHLSVRAQVKRAFFDVLRTREEIDHAQENVALVEDLRNRTQVQVKVGETGRLELTRAEAEVTRADALVRSARLLHVTAISALRAAVSAPLGENLDPEGELDQPAKLPPLAELRKAVLLNHPAARQAQAEIQYAKAILANENALRLPQPTMYAEYEEQPDLGFYRVGVAVPIPVFDRRRGPIAEAAAALSSATGAATQRRLELTAALERAYGQYEVASEQVQSFSGGALREAQAALEGAQAAYRFGERGIIEVLDAQRVLHTVRGDLLDAQYQRQDALIDLEELDVINLRKGS